MVYPIWDSDTFVILVGWISGAGSTGSAHRPAAGGELQEETCHWFGPWDSHSERNHQHANQRAGAEGERSPACPRRSQSADQVWLLNSNPKHTHIQITLKAAALFANWTLILVSSKAIRNQWETTLTRWRDLKKAHVWKQLLRCYTFQPWHWNNGTKSRGFIVWD